MGVELSDKVENIVGKGESAHYPQCFQQVNLYSETTQGK